MKVQRDKLLHFLGGAGATLVASALFTPTVGLAAGVTVGVGKEVLWDRLAGRGTPEPLDAAVTVAGSLLAWLAASRMW